MGGGGVAEVGEVGEDFAERAGERVRFFAGGGMRIFEVRATVVAGFFAGGIGG